MAASLPPVSAASVGGVTPRLRGICSRAQTLGERSDGGGASNSNFSRLDARTFHTTGRVATFGLRLVFANWKAQGSHAGEIAGANAITVEAAVETSTGSPVIAAQVTFNGATSVSIAAGATVVSDPVDVHIPANSQFWIRTGVNVTSGQTWPSQSVIYISNEAAWASTAAGSLTNATGTMAMPSGGASANGTYGPIAVLGLTKYAIPCVGILGASQEEGTGESSSPLARGWAARGLMSVNGSVVPHLKIVRGGETAKNMTVANQFAGRRRRALLQYCTHVHMPLGYNDIVAGDSYSTIKGYLTEIYGMLRNDFGVKVIGSCILPHTTSTDAWATTANQTPTTGFEVSGIRDQLNTWIKSGADGLIDAYLDPTIYVEDATTKGVWIAGSTTDGSHPTSTYHALMAQAMNAYSVSNLSGAVAL